MGVTNPRAAATLLTSPRDIYGAVFAMPDASQELAGHVAIVTGGANGIGRGIALELSARGADVVVADVDAVASEKAAGEVRRSGRKSIAVVTDVTAQESTDAMAAAALGQFGKIDILVNNAGVWGSDGWWEREQITQADWDRVFAVNVFGIVHATKSVERHMQERRKGKIINIASVAGRHGMGGSPHYSASKAAAINITQAFALRLSKSGINVNAIAPGALWTGLSEHAMSRLTRVRPDMGGNGREVFNRVIRERVPLGREQTPEDVGKACAFLASARARSITGQTLNVTGGWQMN